MVSLQIDIPDDVARLIEDEVRKRQLAQPGEYIQELVRADRAAGQQRRIDAALVEALEADPAEDIELTPAWWEAKRARLAASNASSASP
jgi:hypothetical protein